MRRQRRAKIVATLGPASSAPATIAALFEAGTDVFRLNFSHGTYDEHQQAVTHIRALETHYNRPIGILLDLQGPKLRVGTTKEATVHLEKGQTFFLDLQPTPGDNKRIQFPHPEVYAVLNVGMALLLDDGRLRLHIDHITADTITTTVIIGGPLSSRKGVNVPQVALPISALTDKDRKDLAFGLTLGVDWIALSFVQRPEDIAEAQSLIGKKAKIAAKIEKPQAIDHLEEIIALADGIMIARGDLGVEMLPEDVPCLQKRIGTACRRMGKPVIVATQMLDSMVNSPAPTRAEASDVATAIYDGVDAVMLSAESASGNYPVEAVAMMDRIIQRVEADTLYRHMMENSRPEAFHTVSHAIMSAARHIAHTIPIAAIVAFTDSGSTTLMAARERPESPILGLTPLLATARALSLVWGVHAAVSTKIISFGHMVQEGIQAALIHEFANYGQQIIITAGVPFGISGATNIIRVAKVEEPKE